MWDMREARFAWSLLTLAAVGQGCSSDSSAPEGGPTKAEFTETSPGVLSATVEVSASSGATLELPGEAAFIVPAGALAKDTKITIRVPKDQDRASRFRDFEMEPTGLIFAKPATLRVPYELVDGDRPVIRAVQRGNMEPLTDFGSELTDATPMKLQKRDESAKTVDLQVDHFTFFNVFIQVDELLYLVPHIPAKYLLPGDMVFVLTGGTPSEGPDWKPGHVGVFAGGGAACTATANDTVLESTVVSSADKENAIATREANIKAGKPAPPIPASGVRNTSLPTFRIESGHLYLGARRPGEGLPLTSSERTAVVDFAKAQLGKSYNVIGQGNVNEDSWSCVGLAEACYDSIGRGSLGALREALAGTPLELYWNTKPVEEITIGAGELLDMFFQGTFVHPDSVWFGDLDDATLHGWYCDAVPCGSTKSDYQVDVTGKPPAAAFAKSGHKYRLTWLPTAADAGKSFDMTFTMKAKLIGASVFGNTDYGERTTTARLKVDVVPCASPEVPPMCHAPEDPPQNRMACLLSGDPVDKSVSLFQLLSGGTHPNSNLDLVFRPIGPDVDFIDTLTIVLMLTDGDLSAAFGNTYFPCGEGPFARTLCPATQAAQGQGEWVFISARTQGELPQQDPNRHYQYGFVFDADDDTSNNYRAKAPYLGDYFDNTDRWYEAVYTPSGGWKMKVSTANAANVVTPVQSAARIIIGRDTISLAVPKSELSAANPRYRITAFRHGGDYGQKPPYDYSADTDPKVGDPLKPIQ